MQRFKIGTIFKHGRNICTVVDFHVTTNLSGEIVRERYVAAHDFLGQEVLELDIVDTTIARNIIAEVK